MIALDTNILVHALVRSQPENSSVLAWLDATTDALATTNTNVAETLRLITHPKVFPTPLDLGPASKHIQSFLDAYRVEVLDDEPTWWNRLDGNEPSLPRVRGNEVFDAQIALCLHYNGVKRICTLDSDFHKYGFLEVRQPDPPSG